MIKQSNSCYTDGVLSVYHLDEDNTYQKTIDNIRFGEKIVSFKRFYSAKSINEIIERVVKVVNTTYTTSRINTSDLVKISGNIFEVLQIQPIEMDLVITLKAYEGVHTLE